MKKLLGVTLGIMTALGGFVDFGQIVFTMQAGALFQYRLLWSIVAGTIAIITYMEMCGRVAVVARMPVFAVVRKCWGPKFGLAVLVASNLLNLITGAAELGGIAIVIRLLTGWPEPAALVAGTLLLGGCIAFLRFDWIERTFGLAGLMMIVFGVTAKVLRPDWHGVVKGLVPHLAAGGAHERLLYYYFAVGIFSAMLMEYEVHFYSSGALEEDWTPDDLSENFAVSAFGSILGAVLTAALLGLGAILFLPRGIFPELLSTTAIAGAMPFGKPALVIAMVGILACLGGAAIETSLSGGYNLCQFYNLPWGKNRRMNEVPIFTRSWMAMLALGFTMVILGLKPLQLVNISVVFGMVLLPLTYYPILRIAMDREVMGEHVNRRADTVLGMVVLVLIVAASLAAIPLTIATNSGQP